MPKVSIENLKKKYFLTNKEVEIETWCKKPPSNTIKEYFILFTLFYFMLCYDLDF